MRRQAIKCLLGFLFLLGLSGLPRALAQDKPLADPKLYIVPRSEADAPQYFVEGQVGCVLVWAPRTYKTAEKTWRMRVLDATTLTPKVQVSLPLPEAMVPELSKEASDKKGVYMLFVSTQKGRDLVLLYLRYADGAAESERYTLPLDAENEELLLSSQGVYLRSLVDEKPILFYLDPDTRQGQVVPFGPDKATRLVGCGIEPLTGRMWLGLVRKGSNPGPIPCVVRAYVAGQAVGEQVIEGFPIDESPTVLCMSTDSTTGVWVGLWGRRGSEFAQGPFSLQGFRLAQKQRFVDSARFFNYESLAKAERHFRKYSRRKSYLLNNKLLHHPIQKLTGGGVRLVSEHYLVRQSNGYSPLMSPIGPYSYRYLRFFETDFITLTDFAPDGSLKQVKSIAIPKQTYDDLALRTVALPDRPLMCLDKTTPQIAFPNPKEPGRVVWQELPPATLGLGEGQSVTVSRFIVEGTICFAFGEGKDEKSGMPYFFLSRLPEGK